jgi:hypothetical protein
LGTVAEVQIVAESLNALNYDRKVGRRDAKAEFGPSLYVKKARSHVLMEKLDGEQMVACIQV